MALTTWRREVERRMAEVGEDWSCLEAASLPLEAFEGPLDNGRFAPATPSFSLWTARHVYFAAVVEGYPRAGRVPRHPQ